MNKKNITTHLQFLPQILVVFSSILDFQAQVVRGSMIDIGEEMAFLANKARHWFGCRRRIWDLGCGFCGGELGGQNDLRPTLT